MTRTKGSADASLPITASSPANLSLLASSRTAAAAAAAAVPAGAAACAAALDCLPLPLALLAAGCAPDWPAAACSNNMQDRLLAVLTSANFQEFSKKAT